MNQLKIESLRATKKRGNLKTNFQIQEIPQLAALGRDDDF